jgi:hypothetical protein
MLVLAFVVFVLMVIASFVVTLLPARGENAEAKR